MCVCAGYAAEVYTCVCVQHATAKWDGQNSSAQTSSGQLVQSERKSSFAAEPAAPEKQLLQA